MEIFLRMLWPFRSNFMAHQGAAAPILGNYWQEGFILVW